MIHGFMLLAEIIRVIWGLFIGGLSSTYVLRPKLSRRQQEVLQLAAEGHTDREIARILVLSPRTVSRHLSNIYVKFGVPSRAAAVAYAIRHGLDELKASNRIKHIEIESDLRLL